MMITIITIINLYEKIKKKKNEQKNFNHLTIHSTSSQQVLFWVPLSLSRSPLVPLTVSRFRNSQAPRSLCRYVRSAYVSIRTWPLPFAIFFFFEPIDTYMNTESLAARSLMQSRKKTRLNTFKKRKNYVEKNRRIQFVAKIVPIRSKKKM